MNWNNKVLWSEGLFLQPQHFQQQERYLESYVQGRSASLHCYGWGFSDLQLDRQQLGIGKIVIAKARGVFPDGTPFNIPDDDPAPVPLEIDETIRNQRVFLALPIRQAGALEVAGSHASEGLARFVEHEYEAQDTAGRGNSSALMKVGGLRMRLQFESDEHAEYTRLPMAHVAECKIDKQVLLEELFVPAVLDCQASSVLSGLITEFAGMLHHKGESLAGRVVSGGRGSAADIADFLTLQAVNRYEPVLLHLAKLPGLHPERLFCTLVEMAGNMSTLLRDDKRVPKFLPYDHNDLQASFAPIESALRQMFGRQSAVRAIDIPLQEPRFGIRVGTINDRRMLSDCDFVLAVRADLSEEKIRDRFPDNAKVGSVEKIRDLVVSALPGVPLAALAVVPREIPYDAGSVYFKLDATSDHWPDLQNSGGFAIHVSDDFPGIEMDFWAIRR